MVCLQKAQLTPFNVLQVYQGAGQVYVLNITAVNSKTVYSPEGINVSAELRITKAGGISSVRGDS